MAKYTVDFEFTPTLENAAELLMDIAALVSTGQPPTTQADHSDCIARADHDAGIAEAKTPLLARIQELQEQCKRLYLDNERLKAALHTPQPPAPTQTRQGSIPRIGEMVTLIPHPGHEGWTTAVVKAWHGHGGSKGIEVLPRGHGRTEIIPRKYLKRYAANERADAAEAAS